MPRYKFPPLKGGLNTLVDPLVGNLAQSPDCSDVEFTGGLLRQRKGFRRLANEPSYIEDALGTAKTRSLVVFAAASSATGTATFTKTLGTKWTLLLESVFANSTNEGAATRYLFRVAASVNHPVTITAIGDGTNIKIRAVFFDSAGGTVTLDSTNRTAAQWQAIGASRCIRVVRDEATVYLYVGPNLEDSDTFTAVQHDPATNIYWGWDGSANYAQMSLGQTVIVNRVLSEAETYWGVGWPMDDLPEPDILGMWPAIEGSSTTLTDYSLYGNNVTLANTSWTGENSNFARGLGIYTHRLRNGRRYHVLAASRRGTANAGTAPSGALTIWETNTDFYPFYWGGVRGAYDATVTLDGFDYLARWQFVSLADLLYAANGSDYARKYGGTTPALRYWGISAPPTAPVLTVVGSGGSIADGTYQYCYTYYNSNTGTESGRSPVASATAAAGGTDSITVAMFGSSDGQVTHLRVYRTATAGGTTFQLLTQGEIANGTAPTVTDTYATAKLANNLNLAGADASGNGRVKRLYLPGGPPTAPTVAAGAGGSVDNGVHYWAYSWYNPTTGDESGMSPATAQTMGGGNNTGSMSAMDLPDQNVGFTQIRIYRTKAGARIWFLKTTITAAATHSDTVADSTMTATIETRSLPPKCRYAVLFANRLWMFGDDLNPSRVYVSTAGDYESIPLLSFHIANPGAEVTAGAATQSTLFISFNDDKVFALPHPGDEPDLTFFLPLNMREFSPRGACLGHFSIQTTPAGIVWLGRDGFYAVTEQGVQQVSSSITPEFLDLNKTRARYSSSLYIEDRQLYLCWLSQSNERVSEQAFVIFMGAQEFPWTVWNIFADAAGVLIDPTGERHYCFFQPCGYLNELLDDVDYDGDGSGTTSGTVTNATMVTFADLGSRTSPTGGEGGYPIYFRESAGTVYQRQKLDTSLAIGTGTPFYPSLTALMTGTWTVYFHGIRGRWTTMKTEMDDSRPDKTFGELFLTHGKETAGDLLVEVAVDDGSFANANGTPVDLDDDMTSQVSLQKSGRYLQFRITHDPPAMSQPAKIVGLEVDGSFAGDTP